MRNKKLKSFRYLFYVGTSLDHNELVIAVTFVDNFKVKLENENSACLLCKYLK